MKTRFGFIVALQIGAIAALITLAAVTKPDSTGQIVILSSVILVSVVALTGIIVMMAIDAAATRVGRSSLTSKD